MANAAGEAAVKASTAVSSGNRWNDGRMARPDPAYRAVIIAAQSGHAVPVARGELVRVVDVDGHQVGDMWAIDAADPALWLSTGHTRDRCERLSPAVGEQFCDQHGEPILQLVADTSPGTHD